VRWNSRFSAHFQYLTVLAGFMLSLAGCSTSDSVTPKLFSPPESLSNPSGAESARSPSAMEAISRGVAALTPAGAALKDVYYQFDSVELEPDG